MQKKFPILRNFFHIVGIEYSGLAFSLPAESSITVSGGKKTRPSNCLYVSSIPLQFSELHTYVHWHLVWSSNKQRCLYVQYMYWVYCTVGRYRYCAYWGPIFRRFHGIPWPPNGSLNKCLDSRLVYTYINIYIKYVYICIKNGSLNIYLDSRLGVMAYRGNVWK